MSVDFGRAYLKKICGSDFANKVILNKINERSIKLLKGLNCQGYCHPRFEEKKVSTKIKGLWTFKILQGESKLRKDKVQR